MQTSVLLSGGSGLLGQEIQKYLKCHAPSSTELNILQPETLKGEYDIVIHGAAYTDVEGAEIHKDMCFKANVNGTENMVKAYPNSFFVYISTEYAYNPMNFYTYSKIWGENEVKKHENHLIIRTLFKPTPFPFEKAFVDQMTCGDYVDVIARLIIETVVKGKKGMIHLGTGRKSMYQLALKTRPDVIPISVDDVRFVSIPKDYLT